MFQKKPSASEVDDVQYRRAKTWQMGMSMLVYTVILPKCGGTFNQGLQRICSNTPQRPKGFIRSFGFC